MSENRGSSDFNKKAKFKSLTTTKEPVDMSISDIVDMLKMEVKNQANILDQGTANMILDADDNLLDTLLADYDSQLLWNLTNTILGKGILVGLLIGSIANYYQDLKKAEDDGDEGDWSEPNGSGEDYFS